jgi:hypothetical protein
LSKNLFQLTHNYKLEKKKNPSTNPEIKHEKASFNKSIDRFFIGGIVSKQFFLNWNNEDCPLMKEVGERD